MEDLGREGVDEDGLHCPAGALESFHLGKGRRGAPHLCLAGTQPRRPLVGDCLLVTVLGSGVWGRPYTRSQAARTRMEGPSSSCDRLTRPNGGPRTPETGNLPPRAPWRGVRGRLSQTPVQWPPAPSLEGMSRDRKPHLSPISLHRLIWPHSPRTQQPTTTKRKGRNSLEYAEGGGDSTRC